MGLLDRVNAAWSAFRAAPQAPGYQTGSTYLGGPYYMDAYQTKGAPSPAARVEAYKSIVYACSKLNQDAVARVPLRLYADASRGGKPRDAAQPRAIGRGAYERLERNGMSLSSSMDDITEITNYPLLDTIRKPTPLTTPLFTQRSLFAMIVGYTDIVGEAFLLKDGGNGSPPRWLWPLATQYLIPQNSARGPVVESYTYFGQRFLPEELLSFRESISLKTPYVSGYSPAYAAYPYANLEDEFVSIQNTLLGSVRPSIYFAPVDGAMPPQENERKRLEIELNQRFARGGSGGAWVSNGAFKPYPISYSPQDLAGLEITQAVVERMANCFGVPVALLSKDTNLANLEASQVQHARQAVEPRCAMIAETLTALVQEYDPRLFFAFDAAVAEDEVKNADVAVKYVAAGILTINEAREEIGREDVEYGEEPWLPSTLQQPSMAQASHEAGLDAQAAATEQAKNSTANDDLPASKSAKMQQDAAKQKAKQDKQERSSGEALDGKIEELIRRAQAQIDGDYDHIDAVDAS